MDLFVRIYDSIMSALGADKTLFGPSVDIEGITKGDAILSSPETRMAAQDTQKIPVFRTRTPPPKSPPKSSPPTSSQTQSAVLKTNKKKQKRRRATEFKQKKTRSIIEKNQPKSFIEKLREIDDEIKKKQIEEYGIVEKYAKKKSNRNRMSKIEIELEVGSLLENLEKYKAFLKLAKLSKQDTDATSIRIGQYSENRKMLAHKSPGMEDWSQFRKENEALFESLAIKGLDPLDQNNNQGGSSFKNLMPSNSPNPSKRDQTQITSVPPRVRGG